jgi:hypothetical protein
VDARLVRECIRAPYQATTPHRSGVHWLRWPATARRRFPCAMQRLAWSDANEHHDVGKSTGDSGALPQRRRSELPLRSMRMMHRRSRSSRSQCARRDVQMLLVIDGPDLWYRILTVYLIRYGGSRSSGESRSGLQSSSCRRSLCAGMPSFAVRCVSTRDRERGTLLAAQRATQCDPAWKRALTIAATST